MSCPKYLKEAYRKAVDYTCESCHKKEEEVGTLEIHRMIRGNKGGTYKPYNCKIVCKGCHKLIHYDEPGCK